MKIEIMEPAKKIMQNPGSIHNYFAWPSLVRTKNGRIVAGASGFRLAHVCPFGKGCIAVSENEGETYTLPIPVIDTTLDDRDVGLCAFGESGLIVTSFTSSRELQFRRAFKNFGHQPTEAQTAYLHGYYANVPEETDIENYGSSFRVSMDNGITFGPRMRIPVQSPHGPFEMSDGTVLFVGTEPGNESNGVVHAFSLDPRSGKTTERGTIEAVFDDGERIVSAEPYAMEMPDGRIICQIRGQRKSGSEKPTMLTLYQSESGDGGYTWSEPERILGVNDGAPAHLLVHSSGIVISAYGCRNENPGVYLMFSRDNGKTWEEKQTPLFSSKVTRDVGYPMSAELPDGTILTVFYAHEEKDGPAEIYQIKWRLTP